MAIPRLTLVPYLQRWSGASSVMDVHVLLIPAGNPLAPLTDGWPGVPPAPAFSASAITLTANLAKSPTELPMLSHVDVTAEVALTMPPHRVAVFEELRNRFNVIRPDVAAVRSATNTLRKYLPRTYREAFAFVSPRTELAVLDDTYLCQSQCPQPLPNRPPTPPGLSWGEALAFAMRQPELLRALGMLHRVQIQVPPGTWEDGGWLFFTLDSASDYADQAASPGFLRCYATRVPELPATDLRPVFTAALFPVSADAAAAALLGNYDEVFAEATVHDDGFAKIVHGSQPKGADHLDEDGSGLAPLLDEGVQLAWDDETVLIGQNRQVGLNPDGSMPPEAPRGAAGYRIDVRPPTGGPWHTLSRVRADSLVFGTELGPIDTELRTEVHPSRLGDQMWLPAFFTRWKGGSMVLRDPVEQRLRGVNSAPTQYKAVGADDVPLRYGHRYEFRVRLADLTGGGPTVGNEPVNPGEAPTSEIYFKRFVPLGPITVTPEGVAPHTRYRVVRPGVGFPQAVYTGAPNAVDRLTAILDANLAEPDTTLHRRVEIPDPDADHLEIRVLVRPPAFDPAGAQSASGQLGWSHLYTTRRTFPPDPSSPLNLELSFVDVAQLDDLDLAAQVEVGAATGPVPLPTARDLLIELRAAGREDPDYFGNERARRGSVHLLELRATATAEPELFRPATPQQRLRSVFLQPEHQPSSTAVAGERVPQHSTSPIVVKRLATAIDLEAKTFTLTGPPGHRLVFGCHGLTHYLAPDSSSLEFGVTDELTGQWLNVIQADLDRDWTWQGLADGTFEVTRHLRHLPDGPDLPPVTWTAQLQHAVNAQAIRATPDRTRIRLAFLDAFSVPSHLGLPYELAVSYKVRTILANGLAAELSISNRLPVSTPPTQVPRVVTAGHASTPYAAEDDYSATRPQRRMLWLEFAEPPADPRDTYFVRVLAHTPDPMLLTHANPVADPASADLPVTTEPVRVITPDQPTDFAGLADMQPMVRSEESPHHFVVPLPPNTSIDSPDLFGFYSYEICVGHDRGTPDNPLWSTAAGRYGPSTILDGVQHPCPPAVCSTARTNKLVIVSAEYAQPHHRGLNLLPAPPSTQLWAVLYQQIHQADGASRRNLQLDLRPIRQVSPREAIAAKLPAHISPPGERLHTTGYTWWSEDEIDQLCARLGLPANGPLSALVVETLPEPNGQIPDPLGGDLGQVRILRTSPLTAIPHRCC